MEIWDAKGNKVLDSVVTQNAEHVEEMMQSDYVSLQWVSNVKRVLPAGAYIIPFDDGVRYMLLDPYTPDQNNTDEFTYSPQFQHPKMYLGKVPYTRASKDTEGNDINLLEWDYKGYLTTFLSDLCDFITRTFTDEGITTDKFSYSILGDIEGNITFSISNNDILSVLSNVCNTLDCEWHIDWEQRRLYLGNIRFDKNEGSVLELTSGVNVGMASVSSQRDTHFNVYLPQGSTRNMAAATSDGSYYATNRRLELDTEKYPDGKIYTDGEGNVVTKAQFLETGLPKLVQTLMLDEIYPKIDLYVYDVRNRERYLLDDNGDKVIDHYDGETPVYKRYAVWYMRLAYPIYNTNGTIRSWKDATLGDTFKLIDGYTLMCSFGANTDSTLTSPLAGREFELNYVETDKEAKELSAKADSDKGDTGVEVKKGDYEIIYTTEGNLIIPTTEEQGLVPKGESSPSKNGNKVTIFNVVMGEDFIKAAQNDLEVAAIREIKKQYSDLNQYTFNSDNVAFKKDMPSLYIGRSVRYNDGVGNTLDTRIMKLTTKLDFPFMVEITVGNKVLKGSTSQLKTDVQMILSGNRQTASNGITESVVRSLIRGFGGANFLSKLNPDTAAGIITFLQGLVSQGAITANGEIFAKEGLSIGDFVSSLLDGRGAGIDKGGNAEVESLRVRSYMQVMELIINRIRTMDGDLVLTEGDNIESVEEVTDAEGHVSYKLHLKQQWEGYYTAQAVGNVLKGVINTLAQGSGTYYTSWMLVKDVDTATNTITVDLYPDDETPAGKNFPPCDMMNIIRWGNNIDPKRQSCIYLSSTEGVIKKLIHVTKPILDEGNDGFIIGNLPEWLTKDPSVPVDEGDDAVYVKTLLYQNIHQIDYQGKRQPVYVDRGNWVENPAEPYHFEAVNSVTGVYETSDVWYYGCKWRCIKDCPTDAPKWNSMQWMQIEGNPEFSIEIAIENGGLLDFDYFAANGTTLEVTGKIYNLDVTKDILDADVTWTRKSKDAQGNERTESDNAWNSLNKTGKSLFLSIDDINYDSAGIPSFLCFTARAILRDGVAAEQSVMLI